MEKAIVVLTVVVIILVIILSLIMCDIYRQLADISVDVIMMRERIEHMYKILLEDVNNASGDIWNSHMKLSDKLYEIACILDDKGVHDD